MGKTILDMLAADPNVSSALRQVIYRQALATAPRSADEDEADAYWRKRETGDVEDHQREAHDAAIERGE